MKTVFLGGTCNGSQWRDLLLAQLDPTAVNAFNPVVADWNEEAQAREYQHREQDDYCLYVITPCMTGVYSIAEVVDDSNKRPGKTLFAVLEQDGEATFTPAQRKSLGQVGKLVEANGGRAFADLAEVANFLNAA